MDASRFYTAQRYILDVPLQDLSFHVEVWRAPVDEENQVELLCDESISWDTKVYSPTERIEMCCAPLDSSFGLCPQETEETEMKTMLRGTGDRALGTTLGMAQLRESLQNPSSAFFTRPSAEDFINMAEEDCLVVPHQSPSPLAMAVLSHHRHQHEVTKKMLFMWASGGIVASDGISASNALRWDGEEHVMCTITSERDEKFFVAKPSLGDTHTLFVNLQHVYYFKITPMVAECAANALPAESTADVIVRRITSLMDRVKDPLLPPHAGRREVLRQFVLEQSVNAKPKDPAPPEPHGPSCFVFGTVERCLGVSEDALSLRCQWVQPAPRRDDDDDESCFFTQLAHAGVLAVDDFVHTPLHTFNLPFAHRPRGGGAAALRLVVTALSDRRSPAGYAALAIPLDAPGRHRAQAPLWRIRQSGREFLRGVFVGGAPALVDAREVAAQAESGVLARHGLLTEAVGTVEISVMVVMQSATC